MCFCCFRIFRVWFRLNQKEKGTRRKSTLAKLAQLAGAVSPHLLLTSFQFLSLLPLKFVLHRFCILVSTVWVFFFLERMLSGFLFLFFMEKNIFPKLLTSQRNSAFVGVAACRRRWHRGTWCRRSSPSPKRSDLETGHRKQNMSPMDPTSLRLARPGKTSTTPSSISMKWESSAMLRWK